MILSDFIVNIGTHWPFFGNVAVWHYGEGGDLGMWIYAS